MSRTSASSSASPSGASRSEGFQMPPPPPAPSPMSQAQASKSGRGRSASATRPSLTDTAAATPQAASLPLLAPTKSKRPPAGAAHPKSKLPLFVGSPNRGRRVPLLGVARTANRRIVRGVVGEAPCLASCCSTKFSRCSVLSVCTPCLLTGETDLPPQACKTAGARGREAKSILLHKK